MSDRRFARLFSLTVLGVLLPAARGDITSPVSALQQDNRLSLFHDYSIDAVGQTTSSSTGTAGDALINNLLQDSWTVTPGSSRGYTLGLTPVVGYDSNPEARSRARGSIFGGADFNAGYRLNFGADDPLVGRPTQFAFNYDALGAVYEGQVSQADTFQNNVSASARQSLFGNSLIFNLRLDDQFTMLHDAAVLNTVDATPSVEGFLLPQFSGELGYDYANFTYEGRYSTIRNPDANRSTFNLRFHFYALPQTRGVPIPESPDQLTDILRATLNRATLGYAHLLNDSTGSYNEYYGDRIYVGLDGLKLPRTKALTLDVLYSFESDRYTNPEYEGGPAIGGVLKGRKRRDEINLLTFRANARLLDLPHNRGTLSTFLQWDVIADHTFTRDRHWNDFTISGGLSYQY